MLQKLLIFCAVIAITVNTSGQKSGFTNAEIKVSPYKSTKNGEYFNSVLPVGLIGQKVILQGCPYSDLYTSNTVGKRNPDRIVVIDNDLINHKTFSLKRSLEEKDLVYEDMLVLNKKIFTFHSYYNKEKEKQFLFMDEFDMDKWDYKNQLTPIVESECGKMKAKGELNYQFLFSPDSSKLAIVSMHLNSSNYTVAYWVSTFDKNFKLLNQYQLEKSIGETASIYGSILDNDGNIYALLSEEESNSKQWMDYVIKINTSTKEFEKLHLQLADKELINLNLAINSKNNIQVLGLYTQPKLINPRGIISFKYDKPTNKIVLVDNKPFTNEFIVETSDDDGLKKFIKGEDYDEYSIGKSIVLKKSDNGLTYCFEKFNNFLIENKTQSSTTGLQTTAVSFTRYIYDHIFVVDTDETGKINWTSIVKKHQAASGDSKIWASFNALQKGGKTYLLFTDMNKKSLRPFNKKTPLALVEVDENGNQKKELYPLEAETRMWFSLRYPTQTPNNTFYLYGLKGLGNGGYASVQIK